MKKTYFNCSLFLILASLFNFTNIALAQLVPVMNPIQGSQAACSQPSSPKSYTASASNSPTSYAWSFAGPPSGIIFSNPSGSVTTVSFPFPNVNVTYTLYCTASNASGTSASVSFKVFVYETPTVIFSGATSFCQGSSTNLSASPTILSASSSLSYSWSPSIGLNSTSNYTVNAQPPSTTNYTLLLTLGNCSNTAQLTVFVNTCLGIGNVNLTEADQLSVYPNPSNGSFVLKSSNNEIALILNEIGQTLRSFNLIASEEVKINNLPAGIYFVLTPKSRKKIIVRD